MTLFVFTVLILLAITAVFSRSTGSTWSEVVYECAVVAVAVSVFCLIALFLIFTEAIPV